MSGLKEAYQIAKNAMLEGDYSLAAKYFKKMCEVKPGFGSAHYNLASCYFELKNYPAAYKHYELAARFEPDALTYFNLGVVLERLKQITLAREAYENAISIEPGYFEAHFNLAILALNHDEPAIAKKHLLAAKTIQPDNEEIKFHLARLSGNTKAFAKPPISQVEKLFDEYADHFEDHLLGELQYQLPEKIVEEILSWNLKDLDQKTALDLGCGTGLLGESLINYVKSIDGVDISAKMLAFATRKECYHNLHKKDIEEFLSNSQEQYDLIIGADVFNYLGKLDALLPMIKQKLNKNGRLLYSVESNQNQKEDFQLMSTGRYQHSPNYLESIAKKSGFKVKQTKVAGRFQGGKAVKLCLQIWSA